MLMRALRVSLLLAGIAVPAAGQSLPMAKNPEEVGLSGERLKRLSAAMKAGVDKGEIPGAVVLIGRQGKIVYLESFGWLDAEVKTPMKHDAIFRIASMTKPMVSLAIMMLAEEGKLSIAHPASRYLPELKDMKVGIEERGESDKVQVVQELAQREMTVYDLLRHTSGLPYGAPNAGVVKKAWLDARALDPAQTNAEMVAKISKLLLVHQPGIAWEYGMSTDVLGRIVEVVSGMPLEKFLAERIAGPLKMPDTAFFVEAVKKDRGALRLKSTARGTIPVPPVTAEDAWKSGGGGMVSTALDYARFCQFWLNGGELDGVRLVSRKTVELMTSDHLPPGTLVAPEMQPLFQALLPSPEMGQGFGLGFGVRIASGHNPLPGSIGDFYWGGLYGTYFWVDPKEKLFAILMMHAPEHRLPYRYLLRDLVYQAVVN